MNYLTNWRRKKPLYRHTAFVWTPVNRQQGLQPQMFYLPEEGRVQGHTLNRGWRGHTTRFIVESELLCSNKYIGLQEFDDLLDKALVDFRENQEKLNLKMSRHDYASQWIREFDHTSVEGDLATDGTRQEVEVYVVVKENSYPDRLYPPDYLGGCESQ
ncbi:hypothetical protein FQN50_002639 [Emmonsiellopsis sp. PD_5]|nr:hypothetical protein FQN50_002639 [Emmonsiellopsis sp. PD_5]